MQYLVLYAIALYLLLRFATVLLTVQRLLKATIQPFQYLHIPSATVPEYVQDIFKQPTAELESLGFKFCNYLQVEDMYLGGFKNTEALLFHKDSKTYAGVSLRRPIAPLFPFSINFYTFFKDRSLLMTVNHLAYQILGEIPNTTLHDPCVADLLAHWQSHQDLLTTLATTKPPCAPAPPIFLKAFNDIWALYLDNLVKSKYITPIPGANQYQFQWLAAFKVAFKVTTDSKKHITKLVTQLQARAKAEPNLGIEIPIELEMEAYHRTQKAERGGNVKRKLWLWVLIGSFVLATASFFSIGFFNPQILLILIGVLCFHELGHFLAMRLFGYQDTTMFFIPFFGAAVSGRKEDATLTEKVLMLLAGPTPGIVAGIVFAFALDGSPEPEWLLKATLMLVGINLLNLLPIYPFDGGKVANLLWVSRSASASIVFKGLTVGVLLLLGLGNPFLLMIAIGVGLSIPTDLRVTKVDRALRQAIPASVVSDREKLLLEIFRIIKELGYGKLPATQRHNLAKEVVQRHWEGRAKPIARFALSIGYILTLLTGLLGLVIGGAAVARVSPSRALSTAATLFRGGSKAIQQERIAQLDRLIQTNPKDIQAYRDRAKAKQFLRDYQGVIADYDQILRLNPKDVQTYRDRANLRTLLFNNQQGALKDYDQVVKLQPEDAKAYTDRARLKGQLKDYLGALKDYDQAVKLQPKNIDIYSGRVRIKQQLKDYAGALKDHNQIVQLAPNERASYSDRAELKIKLKDYSGAVKDYDRALQLKPVLEEYSEYTNPYLYTRRGKVYYKMGNYQQAVKNATQALSVADLGEEEEYLQQEAYYLRSRARQKLGDLSGAKEDLQKAGGAE